MSDGTAGWTNYICYLYACLPLVDRVVGQWSTASAACATNKSECMCFKSAKRAPVITHPSFANLTSWQNRMRLKGQKKAVAVASAFCKSHVPRVSRPFSENRSELTSMEHLFKGFLRHCHTLRTRAGAHCQMSVVFFYKHHAPYE